MKQSKNEEKVLLDKLKTSPDNINLLNEAAIFYLENPNLSQDCLELDYFEKAYNKEKNIKSTHNLAYYLFFEDWKKEDKAIEIQKECIALKPKSALPYELYAYFMLEKGNYEKSIKYYLLAKSKGANNYHVNVNLGIAFYHEKEFKKAKEYLKYSIELSSSPNLSLYNLSIIYLTIGDKEKAKLILQKIIENTDFKFTDDIGYLEISTIYYFLEDYQKSSELSIKFGGSYDLMSYREIMYSLFVANREMYYKKINHFIMKNEATIAEIKNNIDDWENEAENEKEIATKEATENIREAKKITAEFKKKRPKSNLSDHIIDTHCSCLLFGCKTHGNPDND